MIMNRYETTKLSEEEAIVLQKDLINLPASRLDMDQLITVYFKNGAMLYRYWIRMHFLKNYMKLNYILEQGHYKEYKGVIL